MKIGDKGIQQYGRLHHPHFPPSSLLDHSQNPFIEMIQTYFCLVFSKCESVEGKSLAFGIVFKQSPHFQRNPFHESTGLVVSDVIVAPPGSEPKPRCSGSPKWSGRKVIKCRGKGLIIITETRRKAEVGPRWLFVWSDLCS